MARVIAFHLAVFAVPFAVYAAYVYFARRPATLGAVFDDAPILWLVLTGLVMTIGVFLVVAAFTGADPGGVYVPPHIEDGVIVPGRIVPPDAGTGG